LDLDLNREEVMMLELTENAASALKRAIGRDQGEAKGVRIALVPSGCAEFRFKLDLAPAARDSESVFETSGVPIFVNRTATGFIKGTRIDYVESLEGGSFIFQNPNAESTCVCGRSFTPSREMFYAVCAAESIEPGWVKPFMLEKAGADGAEPFPILIARDNGNGYYAYVNNCPQEPHVLYEGAGRSLAGAFLLCARHETKYEMKTGLCAKGPGKGARLARIPVKVLDGEVCVSGITLLEDDEAAGSAVSPAEAKT
jgi:iron-sulfur cluster assembly protein